MKKASGNVQLTFHPKIIRTHTHTCVYIYICVCLKLLSFCKAFFFELTVMYISENVKKYYA